MDEVQIYKYVFKGGTDAVGELIGRAEKIKGVISVSPIEGGAVEIAIENQVSEYDVFTKLIEYGEELSVDVDYFDEENDGSVEEGEIAVEEIGEEQPDVSAATSEPLSAPDEEKTWTKRYWGQLLEISIASVLLIVAAAVKFPADSRMQSVLCLVAFALVGYEIVWDAIAAFARKDYFNYYTFMMIAAVAAVFVSPSYLEGPFLAIIFESSITLGKIFTSIKERKVQERFYFDHIIVTTTDENDEAFAKDLKTGDEAYLNEGDVVPFDCRVKEGVGKVLPFDLSGKAHEIPFSAGSFIRAGSVIGKGNMLVAVEKTTADSLPGRIYAELTRKDEATEKRASLIKKSLPVCLAIALVVAFAAPSFAAIGGAIWTESFFKWAYVATIFLAVSCCFSAVVEGEILSISALNRTLSMNILTAPRSGLYRLGDADTVVFNDPGALVSRGAIEKIAAKPSSREKFNDIIAKYGEKAIEGDFRTSQEGEEILIADFDTVSDSGINVKPAMLDGEVKYVCLGSKVLGAFSVGGGLKDEAFGCIRELKDAGIKSIIKSDIGEEIYGNISKIADIRAEKEETPDGENVVKVADCIEKTGERGIYIGGAEEFADLGGIAVSADGSVKSIAKTIKLAKRFKLSEKRNNAVIIAGKIVALAAGVAVCLLTPASSLWIAALIDGIVGALVLLGSFAIDREIY